MPTAPVVPSPPKPTTSTTSTKTVPTPEPTKPAPGPCDRPEADQKALRGDVLKECPSGLYLTNHASTARECYDRLRKPDRESIGLRSYVFTSQTEPGSPIGGILPEFNCAGYRERSYRYFKGSPTGSAFGGDLTLDFE